MNEPRAAARAANAGAPAEDELMIVGRVRKPQGLHGELLVEALTDAPDTVFAPGRRVRVGTRSGEPDAAGGWLTVKRARPFKGGLIVGFGEIADRTAAESWRERYLLAPMADLPALAQDELYRHDLLGMRVEHVDGRAVGQVAGFYDLPQGLTLEVRTGAGAEVLLPYRPEIVHEVDVGRRLIRISPPAGLFE